MAQRLTPLQVLRAVIARRIKEGAPIYVEQKALCKSKSHTPPPSPGMPVQPQG